MSKWPAAISINTMLCYKLGVFWIGREKRGVSKEQVRNPSKKCPNMSRGIY